MEISLEKVNFSYEENNILDDLSCVFRSGKINYLVGYNGAGKSTLFDVISGAVKKQSGIISGVPDAKDILYQVQNPAVFGALTGKDVQKFIFGVSTGHKDVDMNSLPSHFKKLYTKLQNRKVGDMSVGERRWLITFLQSYLDKKLFLLDEPTAGVDPVSRKQINKILTNLAQGFDKLVIVATHDLNSINDGRIYLLNNHEITMFNSKDDFIAQADSNNIEDAFEILVGE